MVLDSSWNETTKQYGHEGVTLLHCCALITGVANWLLNSVIWFAFLSTPKLLTKAHLYLFYAFAVANTFTGFFTIPTYINVIIHNNLNCPRWTILIGSSFEIAFDRIRSIITLAIAAERVYALYRPGDYYFLDHRKVALRIYYVAALWGFLDAVSMILEDDLFTVRVHCVTTSSSGPYFHIYFLLSAIAAGLLLTLVYFILLFKLFVLKGNQVLLNRKMCRDTYQQANSLTVMVILMVMIFSVLPSSLYLYDMLVGEVVFMRWGPIITIGYHCYGITSFFFYNCKHREIRLALNELYPLRRWLVYCGESTAQMSQDGKGGVASDVMGAARSSELIAMSTRAAPANLGPDVDPSDEVFL